MRLRQRLAERGVEAVVADRRGAIGLLAALADFDRFPALLAADRRDGWLAHDAALRPTTSSCVSRPTRRPSEVVMGAETSRWSSMNSAISAAGTNGRNVLGAGRMACSTGTPESRSSSFERS